MSEHLWVKLDGSEVPLKELSEDRINDYIRSFQMNYPSWDAFRRRWLPEFENELIRRRMTPENLEICNTSFMLDQIIKQKEEEQYSKPVVGWKGFLLTLDTVEKEISRTANKVVIERTTGLMITGAKATWDSIRMEAHCLDYSGKTQNDASRQDAFRHIKNNDTYCKCGLYCYFDKQRCVNEHEFEVVAKVTGWGTVGWAKDGARCSDMRIEQIWIVKNSFINRRFAGSLESKYIDFDRMASDLAVIYDNQIDVCWVEDIKDIPD